MPSGVVSCDAGCHCTVTTATSCVARSVDAIAYPDAPSLSPESTSAKVHSAAPSRRSV